MDVAHVALLSRGDPNLNLRRTQPLPQYARKITHQLLDKLCAWSEDLKTMTSLQVPPQGRRRRRVVDEEYEDERSTRATTPLSQSSTSSKRIRLDDPDIKNDVDDDADGDDGNDTEQSVAKVPLTKSALPPGYTTYKDFQPGAIVRMKLKDFVTYTNVEYHFGSQLNMIIGPNGTGKSTLVCAICLGLGWGPQHLGRAKDASEFVKHGCKEAIIEIELARGPPFKKNPVVRRVIKFEGNKSTFSIDGRDASRKQVMKLAQKFSIQIDNLCQFLPQDKVSEFAALTPVELLYSTQRAAAGPQMIEWHDDLKRIRAEQKRLLADNKGDRDLLSNLQNRQELQRADVERVRERAKIKRRIEILELARPLAAYKTFVPQYQEIKNRKQEVEAELQALKAEVEPILRSLNAKQEYFTRTDELVKFKRRGLVEAESSAKQIATRMDKHEESMKNLTMQIESEKKEGATYKQQLSTIQQAINRITRQIEEKPEGFDIDAYNEKIRACQRAIKDFQHRAEEIKEGRAAIYERLNEKETRIQETENELQNLETQNGQREAMLRKFSPDTHRAYRWVLDNQDKFEHTVYGPALIECSIKDPRYADVIESLLQKNDFLAFTTQSIKDFRTLQKVLNVELKLHDVSIRNCTTSLSDLKPSISEEEMRDLGFDGWAKDYLEGPEPVIAMLCNEQFLFRTPVVLREINDREYSRMESHNAINSWVAGKQTYKVNRRKEYGPGATSTQVRQVRPARFWTDQPINVSLKQELLDTRAQLDAEKAEIEKAIQSFKLELTTLGADHKEKVKEKSALEKEKSDKQTALVNYRSLPEKLRQQQIKKRDLEKGFEGLRGRVQAIRAKQDQVALDKAETAIACADAVENLRVLHHDLIQAEIRNIEALSDFENLRMRNEETRQRLDQKQDELKEAHLKQREAAAEGRRLRDEVAKIRQLASTEPDMLEVLESESIRELTMDKLEADIDSEKARLELTHEVSEGMVKEFEDRQRAIDKLQDKMSNYQAKLNDLESAIQEIRGKWEPRLDALVKTISDAFSDSFARIGCAGQVTVDKVEDEPGPNGEPGGSNFDQWSIQIQVKFRETENLSVLDSHRQSGGERAVSTIFYLIALQSLSASPFRVVDEINQGMDPRNERMVHGRMVDIACAPRNTSSSANGADDVTGGGGSQYFLVTPKLLSGLHYRPGITVQCIASGEHVPADFHSTDFRHAIESMKKIKAAKAGHSLTNGRAQSVRVQ
ncbi:structural maintenance of chromosome complex subunit SmcA [Talaromyces stipitatus ATCC 10500]|uniref:Structural maintenance of chromosomes protein 5 n=1 Tax=Talaromyces stipitatus (strain ATCC 10500 / CBS 375.48 / QM 6759 / NRRL 1006) TaxID=441959 RepID=B8MKL9_TALSN|nr:structural maintenance of chromosome complex subunit SmcA [Talaromyces stipitatus ATCC 10500]EED15374.1 structural maintenance of chromosome complex subunit SmcA [Talaromyces stipitatus ATCC 10500]